MNLIVVRKIIIMPAYMNNESGAAVQTAPLLLCVVS